MDRKSITWEGPYAWPNFENAEGNEKLKTLPEVEGVYTFTFELEDGYVAFWPGYSGTIKTRMDQHRRDKFEKGEYHVFDLEYALKGKRKDIWPWKGNETNPTGFGSEMQEAVKKQLAATRIFIAKITNEEISNVQVYGNDNDRKRKRFGKRLESAFINHLDKETAYWSDLMYKRNKEIGETGMQREDPIWKEEKYGEAPIEIKNICEYKIYGLPEIFKLY